MKITLVTDNPNSWAIPHARILRAKLLKAGHKVRWVKSDTDIRRGDCAFFLSYEGIVKKKTLALHDRNIVVHASRLPKGRGMSPLTWQILAGKNKIPLTLFEIAKRIDSGPIYLTDYVRYEGHELIDELRQKLGEKINNLILCFIKMYKKIKSRPQKGRPSYYPWRSSEDSMLDIDKSLKEQFHLLRVVDNVRYPAFFLYKGYKYILKISKANS